VGKIDSFSAVTDIVLNRGNGLQLRSFAELAPFTCRIIIAAAAGYGETVFKFPVVL
jgi:hypothetical protein